MEELMRDRLLATLIMLVFVGVLGYSLAKCATYSECTPAKRGQMRSIGEYGGPVQVCNGTDWVPAKMPEQPIP